jgi:alkylation response protein AidB-like acyl-CoA dehydrogenase
MWHYRPPLADMRFVIEQVLEAPARWAAGDSGLDADTATQVLEEAGRFAAEVLQPVNAEGDSSGCRWEAGRVSLPAGYRHAYRQFVEGGWPALACDPAWGGQGLPQLVNMALYEMLNSACHAWTMYPGLAHGAYECLKAHGTPELQQRYLAKIVSGEWLATMCLTEAHAGSDLGLLRTRAEPQADGSVRVSGTKIFISGGDHDLTDNIVHLVLCRLPDAPPGSKGLSLALVPRLLPDGTANGVGCDGVEKKMGIKGSATCTLRFEAATGWLIGEPHRGLAAMFVMMNAARLQVAMQGLGHLEMATQNALRYAFERVQMRALRRPEGSPAGPADPIALHPAMRRTLWALQARTEGSRVLAYWCAMLLDEPAAQGHVALLTPVLKSLLTRLGFEGASDAQQVWGGHGYLHDWGIEQSVRDARIALVYEGTNEIQAVDLLQRKVLGDGGAALGALLDELAQEVALCAERAATATAGTALQQQIEAVRQATAALVEGHAEDTEWPLRVAGDYLDGAGHALLAWAWARSARVALAQPDERLREHKLAIARYGREWLLPEAGACWQRVLARHAALPWLDEAAVS